jgi:hypothetical protein
VKLVIDAKERLATPEEAERWRRQMRFYCVFMAERACAIAETSGGRGTRTPNDPQ